MNQSARRQRRRPSVVLRRPRTPPRPPREELAALDGKRLACWCAPDPCHGEVLARAAAWAASVLAAREAE